MFQPLLHQIMMESMIYGKLYGKNFYKSVNINIFNRYGKLVAQIPIDSQGWNGTYNGKKLSSDDYWYNITLIPADNTKQKRKF